MHHAPHIIIDISALPNAIETATLTMEDWRLMLISLHWVHNRFGQHPEQAESIRWFSRNAEGLVTLLQLHPKLIMEMRVQWPTLNDLLVNHPSKEGIWKSFAALKKMHYPAVDSLSFWRRDALRPLQRWMAHEAAMLDVASMFHEDEKSPRTLVHSLGLPLSEEHADSVQIVTVQDLSLLHFPPALKHLPFGESKREWLLKQLDFLRPEHMIIVWDRQNVDALLEYAPHIVEEQIIVAPPCWLMEMPAELSKRVEEAEKPGILEDAFKAWIKQVGWDDIPDQLDINIEALKNDADLGPIAELITEEVIEQIKDVASEPQYIIASLRDDEHEHFQATLSMAYLGIIDTLKEMPDDLENPETPIEKLALHLMEENGEAVALQGRRKLLCFYTPGTYLKTKHTVMQHPYYDHFKDRILLLPSTPMNKALLYPKALAFCAFPLGNTFYPTVLEAMAYALPIVAPHTLETDITAQHGGVLYDPSEVMKLPSLLDDLQRRESHQAKRAKYAARKAAETRSWQAFGQQLWKAYIPQ